MWGTNRLFIAFGTKTTVYGKLPKHAPSKIDKPRRKRAEAIKNRIVRVIRNSIFIKKINSKTSEIGLWSQVLLPSTKVHKLMHNKKFISLKVHTFQCNKRLSKEISQLKLYRQNLKILNSSIYLYIYQNL